MNIKFNIDDTVSLDGVGEYKVLRCMPGQYTRYEVENITPDDEHRTWHQRDGVTEIAHRDRLKLLINQNK